MKYINNTTSEFLFLPQKNGFQKVEVRSILYAKVEEKYCFIVCEDKKYMLKISLSRLKEILSSFGYNFRQVHRNYLVHMDKVDTIYFEDHLITLTSNDKIPFSERYQSSFKQDYLVLVS